MMKRNTQSYRNWSELPPELVQEIAKRLESHPDIAEFRTICHNWCFSVVPPPLNLDPKTKFLPRKIIFPATRERASYSAILLANAVYVLRHRHRGAASPGDSWLVSVEQRSPGKLVLYHALTRKRLEFEPEDEFPKCLVSNFNALQVSGGFNFRSLKRICNDDDKNVIKVIFWSVGIGKRRNSLDINDNNDHLNLSKDAVVILQTNGLLLWARLDKDKIITTAEPILCPPIYQFDDIERLQMKELILAVDRLGRLYGIEHETMNVSTMLTIIPPPGVGLSARRKRLVVDWIGDIYLVYRGEIESDGTTLRCEFSVYKLNQDRHVWVEVRDLKHKILFMSSECCYFLPAANLPGLRDNCIVFYKGCCPVYSGANDLDDPFFQGVETDSLKLGVCDYGSNNEFKLIQSCPGFSDVFQPPKRWVSKDALPSYQWRSINEGASNKSQNPRTFALRDSWSGAGALLELDDNHEEVTSSLPSGVSTEQLKENHFLSHDLKLLQIRKGITFGQSSQTMTPRAKFQGVDVSTEFMPILAKVWDKYGDIADETIVHSAAFISIACESLAKLIGVLQTTTANTMNDQKAEYLASTLSDLKLLGLKIDWLVPFVEKALFLHKNKPLADALMKLEKAKVHAEDMQKKFLAGEGSQLELESLTASGPIDLEKCLGEGLF